jgi:F-type H+-transporting ATPase subunit alpha
VSQAQLDRGYRLTELLKQPLHSPMPVEEQVVTLYAGTRGYLDTVPVAEVRRFEQELLEWFRTRHGDVLDAIRSGGAIPDEAAFEAGVRAFAEQFQGASGGVAGSEPEGAAQGDASRRMQHDRGLLPEEEISREPEPPGASH